MIEMAMRTEVVNGLQVVIADVVLDGLELSIIESTAVYNDTL